MADYQIDSASINIEVTGNAATEIAKVNGELEKLEGIDGGKISSVFDQASSKIEKFAVSIDHVLSKEGKIEGLETAIAQAYTRLTELTQGGSGYENKEVRSLISQIERLDKELADNKLQLAFDQVSKSTGEARINVDEFINSFSKTDFINSKLSNTKAEIEALVRSGETVDGNPALQKLIEQAQKLQAELDKMDGAAEETGNGMEDFNAIVDGLGLNANKQIKGFTDAANEIVDSDDAVGVAMGTVKAAFTGVGMAVDEVKKKINMFVTVVKLPFKIVGKLFNFALYPVKKIGEALKGLWETAKRFLVFGTFFTVQRQVSEAFTVGIENIYQYSKAIDGTLAKSLDRVTTSLMYLKNGIAAAVAPLINFFTPALESLADAAAEAGNRLAEIFAKITGAATYKKAVKTFSEFAATVEKTNNALAKFDEINNITTKKGNELDYGSMFEEVKVTLGGESFASILKNAIKKGDWNGVGRLLAQKLNGVIAKLNAAEIPKKISSAFSNGLNAAHGFITTFDFKGLGKFLFDGFYGIFNNEQNWTKLGETFGAGIQGVLDIVSEAVEGFDPIATGKNLYKGLTKLLDQINWDELGNTVSKGITKVFKFGSTIAKLFGDKEFRNDITNKFSNFMMNIDWEEVGDTLGTMLIDVLAAAWNWATDFENWKKIAGVVSTAFLKLIMGIIRASLRKYGLESYADNIGKILGVPGYAEGGYPQSGQMFIARENGIPEMVGSIGNRTAVANNDQIVDAVSIGVYNAVVDAMGQGSNGGDTIVQIDGREVFRAVRNQNNSYKMRTGSSAF